MTDRTQQAADTARNYIRKGIEYLIDDDGYTPDEVQEFIEQILGEYRRDD